MKTTVAALLLAVLTACDGQGTPAAVTAAPAPELAVLDLDGSMVKLADYRGKVVLLNFWINGCGPCLAEMPVLDAVYRDRKAEGFTVLGINTGQDRETIVNTRRRVPVSFPLLSDQLSITSKTYNVVGFPVSFLVDAQGIIRERIDGPLTRSELEGKIAALH